MIVLSFLIMAQAGLAVEPKTTNYGLDVTAKQGLGENTVKPENSNISSMIGKIVGAALSFLGVVFFILIIYGGYMWMFSMGNEQTAGKAKDIIVAAVIGLVIVLAAYAITTYLAGALGQPTAPALPATDPVI